MQCNQSRISEKYFTYVNTAPLESMSVTCPPIMTFTRITTKTIGAISVYITIVYIVPFIDGIAFIHIVASFIILVDFEEPIETRTSVTKDVASVIDAFCRVSVTLMDSGTAFVLKLSIR